MLQLVYISTARKPVEPNLVHTVLDVSRRNNARDGITGLLFFEGRRFLQALEGSAESVERTFVRIRADPRHFAVVELSRRMVDTREFGPWAMAARTDGVGDDAMLARIDALVAGTAPAVQATFASFARLHRAA